MAKMSEETFISIVKQSELAIKKNLGSYKFRLLMFAVLGYVVIFGAVFLLVVLLGGSIVIGFFSSSLLLFLIKKKIAFGILIGIWVLIRALWVKFDPPQGLEVTANEYPLLFAEIDELREKLDALPIHRVMVSSDLNAFVEQRPRFGLFGANCNILTLGVQLMMVVSPEEARSILAHEMGHLSGNHSKFSGWIYRVRISWTRIMEALENTESFGARIMRKFFDWYAPRFSAYSFALARQNEYEADAVAAELTNPAVASSALINIHGKAPFVQKEYWAQFYKAADYRAHPSSMPYTGLRDFIVSNGFKEDVLASNIEGEFKRETHYADTHPSLNDRVLALGVTDHKIQSNKQSAGELWFGDGFSELINRFDESWATHNLQDWQGRFEYVKEAKQKLVEYSQRDPASFSLKEHWDYAIWTFEFEGDEKALPLFELYLEQNPKAIGANYYVGEILYRKDDEACLEFFKVAFDNPELIQRSINMGYDLLQRHNKSEQAEQWLKDSQIKMDAHRDAWQERQQATIEDELVAPSISEELLKQLVTKMESQLSVKKAWLAQKVVKHHPDDPVYIFSFVGQGIHLSQRKLIEKVAKNLDIDAHLFIVCFSGDTKKLAKKVKKVGMRLVFKPDVDKITKRMKQ